MFVYACLFSLGFLYWCDCLLVFDGSVLCVLVLRVVCVVGLVVFWGDLVCWWLWLVHVWFVVLFIVVIVGRLGLF